MTRGRRKDLTIPPSRALLQQRDYRARKAQYLSDLEDRLRRAEDENTKLRREIDTLRMRATTSGAMGPSPEVVAASSELMHQLTAAASCLARFQQLTFNEQAQQAHAIAQAQMQTQNLHPPPLPPMSDRPTLPSMHEAISLPQSQGTSYPPSTPSHSSHSQSRQPTPPRNVLHPSRHTQHHSLSPTLPPVHSSNASRHDFPHVRMSPPETPRRGTSGVPSSAVSIASTSVSVSASTSAAGGGSPSARRLPSRDRSNSYAIYNEAESAWGYFDSRDLDGEDDEDEDQLFAEEGSPGVQSHRSGPRRSPPHAHVNGHGHGHGHGSLLSSRQTSDMRSTSSSGSEDSPMRMREDSPMRTR